MKKSRNSERLRSFGRTYTKKLGLLHRSPYHPDLSLLQSRIIFELHRRGESCARDLLGDLEIDKGYLSRAVAGMVKEKLLRAQDSPRDGREKRLALTAKGERMFAEIDRASRERAGAFLDSLGEGASGELVRHLVSAEILMREEPLTIGEVRLRSLVPGDIGWVIGRHGEVYNREYGWNLDFEVLVGQIAVSFAAKHDPEKERAWIAEARGVRLGCVFLVRESEHVAKLRILLVDPVARGLGLGTLLVRECVRFARRSGYRKLVLWTNSVLHSARRIYQAEGFQLVREEPHRSFGRDLVGQYWSLDL